VANDNYNLFLAFGLVGVGAYLLLSKRTVAATAPAEQSRPDGRSGLVQQGPGEAGPGISAADLQAMIDAQNAQAAAVQAEQQAAIDAADYAAEQRAAGLVYDPATNSWYYPRAWDAPPPPDPTIGPDSPDAWMMLQQGLVWDGSSWVFPQAYDPGPAA
jgi:hypothetical protein